MTAFWQMRAMLLLTVLFGLMLLTTMLPHGTQAQGQTLPTPTNVGNGGSGGNGNGGNGDDESTPKPPGARVSGFVYNYSTGAYEGGVKVVISGGGWEAETVSDSNGFYQVGDLGVGNVLVNLRLPPGAYRINADTVAWLVSGADVQVDLGFYWGDTPSLPVQLSANLKDNLLTVQLQNHTAESATGSQIEVALPASILASPEIQASQGSVDYGEHKLRIIPGDLATGANVTITIPVDEQAVPAYAQTNASIQVTFTYDQQLTPQVIRITPTQPTQVATLPASGPDVPAVSAASVTPQVSLAPPTPAAAQTQLKPLPITGSGSLSNSSTNWWLPLLFVIGLGLAGWWSWQRKS